MAGGPEPLRDDHPGVLDPDDLLVFMACDAGERAPGGAPPAARGTRDPDRRPARPHHRLGLPRRRRPIRRSPARATSSTTRRTTAWSRGALSRRAWSSALPADFAVGLSGPMGPNLLDGLRLRAEATLHAGLAHWTISERDGKHELIAWTRGPGARRAPLAPQGRHRARHPAHRRPGAHLLLRRARLRAGRA